MDTRGLRDVLTRAMNETEFHYRRSFAKALLLVLGLTLPGLVAPGLADTTPTYDKRIEEAAIRMLIPKLGDMRGSLGLKSDEYLRPLANRRVIENKASRAPAAGSRERSKGSFLFF